MKKYPITPLTLLALMLSVASVASVHSFSIHSRPDAASGDRRELPLAVAAQAARWGNPWINLLDGRELATTYTGGVGFESLMKRGLAHATALAAAGFDYEFRDAALPGSGRYWYVLETVALDGSRQRVGPVAGQVKRFDFRDHELQTNLRDTGAGRDVHFRRRAGKSGTN